MQSSGTLLQWGRVEAEFKVSSTGNPKPAKLFFLKAWVGQNTAWHAIFGQLALTGLRWVDRLYSISDNRVVGKKNKNKLTLHIQMCLARFTAEGVDKLTDDVSGVFLIKFVDVQCAHVTVILDTRAPSIAHLYAILEPVSHKSENTHKG